ncbi:putative transposable element [Trichonephila clavipes]|nr:putative transposable element [Trichonephila clavipes]
MNNHDVQELWFQQDGATCHIARATIDLLKDTLGDHLISRFGPVNWPPRSCDLTPLDYFLWGYVKSLVYADKPQTLNYLEDNILRVIADIRPQMLEKVIRNWTSRLDYIRASRGSHMPEILFKIPKLPTNIKAGYLSWKVCPYIPNPLRCFKCQRFGHSQISCRGQLTCSRCASVGHASTDCRLEPKCINCSLPHTAVSKLCPKWKNGKQIQEIKTNKNITYVEARKLIVPPSVKTYAESAKPSIVNNSTQTDENITKKWPPLNLLQPLSSLPKPNTLISTLAISTSFSSTQAELLPSISTKAALVLEPEPPISMSNDVLSNMFTSIESSSIVSSSLSNDI